MRGDACEKLIDLDLFTYGSEQLDGAVDRRGERAESSKNAAAAIDKVMHRYQAVYPRT